MSLRATLLAATLLAASAAYAQQPSAPIPSIPNDWAPVQNTPAGIPLVIKPGPLTVQCDFVSASPDMLTCKRVWHSWLFGDHVFSYDISRQDVSWVKTPARKGPLFGMLVGVAAGVVLGVSGPDKTSADRATGAYFGVFLGGALGALVGHVVDTFRNENPGRHPIYVRP